MTLTPKQLALVCLIRDYRALHGFSPTMQEAADKLGVSKVTIWEHSRTLLRKGALVSEPGKFRSLDLAPGLVLPASNGHAPTAPAWEQAARLLLDDYRAVLMSEAALPARARDCLAAVKDIDALLGKGGGT